MNGLKDYIKLIKEEQKRFNGLSVWRLLKHYKKWADSLKNNAQLNELPWMTFDVIDFLKTHSDINMRVFEYGSGSSTLFWSSRVKEVISIEHDKNWCENVKRLLAEKNRTNVELLFIEPQTTKTIELFSISDPYKYRTDDEQWKSFSFENYVRIIEKQPDNHFDYIVVDGRARPSCIAASINKVKVGGHLIVDNSERNYYFKETQKLLPQNQWKRTDFTGPIAGATHFSQTSVFKKLF